MIKAGIIIRNTQTVLARCISPAFRNKIHIIIILLFVVYVLVFIGEVRKPFAGTYCCQQFVAVFSYILAIHIVECSFVRFWVCRCPGKLELLIPRIACHLQILRISQSGSALIALVKKIDGNTVCTAVESYMDAIQIFAFSRGGNGGYSLWLAEIFGFYNPAIHIHQFQFRNLSVKTFYCNIHRERIVPKAAYA